MQQMSFGFFPNEQFDNNVRRFYSNCHAPHPPEPPTYSETMFTCSGASFEASELLLEIYVYRERSIACNPLQCTIYIKALEGEM